MNPAKLRSRTENQFREEQEMDNLGRKAWDNPAYEGSPSLKIKAIYNPKTILENPYDSMDHLGDPPPYQEKKMKRGNCCSKFCSYIGQGIRGKFFNLQRSLSSHINSSTFLQAELENYMSQKALSAASSAGTCGSWTFGC